MAENLNASIERMKFDKRMLDYNIKQGLVNSLEYQTHLSKLEDLKEFASSIQFHKLVSPQNEGDEEEKSEEPSNKKPTEENEAVENNNYSNF